MKWTEDNVYGPVFTDLMSPDAGGEKPTSQVFNDQLLMNCLHAIHYPFPLF
jgi:hypothetical protein